MVCLLLGKVLQGNELFSEFLGVCEVPGDDARGFDEKGYEAGYG